MRVDLMFVFVLVYGVLCGLITPSIVGVTSWENCDASSNEAAIAEIIVRVFPRPISSAMIPPLASSGGRDC